MQIVKYRNMTIATFDTLEEAELFTGTNQDREYTIEEIDSPPFNDTEQQRQRLHENCAHAYQVTGNVRSPEWKAAKARLTAFEAKYGRDYNPD